MTERDEGVTAKIAAFRESERLKEEMKRRHEERRKNRKSQQIEEESRRHNQALAQSFLILRPIIVPVLQDIADNYRDASDLPLEQPQVKPYIPVFSDLDSSVPGYVALIWGSPHPLLHDFDEMAIDYFVRADTMLKSGKKLSTRRREHFEELLRRYGKKEIEIFGINTLFMVADTKENLLDIPVPVVRLTGNTILTQEERDTTYDVYHIKNDVMIQVLSRALNRTSRYDGFMTDVRTLVTVGAKNIRPTGPFI